MKPIRALPDPTPRLAMYLREAGDGANWMDFRSYEGSGDAYRELLDAMDDRQHGLCGYCEVSLHPRERQVEHFQPQAAFPALAVDHLNMIACCEGGAPSSAAADIRGDQTRYLRPVKRNLSCGSAKGETWDENLLDPRKLPAVPSPIRVLVDGSVEPDGHACARTGVEVSQVSRTINILGLNVLRLRRVRQRHWQTLRNVWRDKSGDEALIRAGAERELLPDKTTGKLPSYFTASRSFFRTLSDGIDDLLSESLDIWI